MLLTSNTTVKSSKSLRPACVSCGAAIVWSPCTTVPCRSCRCLWRPAAALWERRGIRSRLPWLDASIHAVSKLRHQDGKGGYSKTLNNTWRSR